MTIVFSGSPVANVQLSDSFNTWRLTTNKILSDAASLTANNTFAGTGSFSSTLNTTGAASFSNTVSVTGALTASRTLTVTNNITAAGNISANSYVTTGDVTANNITATLVTATDFNSTSDNRLKENIETIENPNDVISQLRGVSFNWKNNGAPSYGVIAQELQQIVPDLVHENQSGDLTVQYMGLIAFLIESNKKLLDRIIDLETKCHKNFI